MDSRELEHQTSKVLDKLNKLITEMKAQAEIPQAMHNELHTDLVLNQNNPHQAVIVITGEEAVPEAITLMQLLSKAYSSPIKLPWQDSTTHIRNPFKENN